MSTISCGAARVTYSGGEVQHVTYSPDIPSTPQDAEVLAQVTRLSLLGDIVSVEPVEVQVPGSEEAPTPAD